jgi:hypothetical protein
MKTIISICVFALLTLSCSQKSPETTSASAVNLGVDEFVAEPQSYINKEIVISGLVTHVCKHGGQKLFLAGKESGNSIRISTSENIAEFPLDLEGSMVEFTGIVQVLDDEALHAEETEEKEHHEGESESDTCEAEKLSLSSSASYFLLASSYKISEQ